VEVARTARASALYLRTRFSRFNSGPLRYLPGSTARRIWLTPIGLMLAHKC